MAVLTDAQLSEIRPLVIATACYFALFYTFMTFQSFTKLYLYATKKQKASLRELKYGDNKKGLNLCSDRTFLNLFEQSVPFLTSVWIYGLVVDATFAATLVYIYMSVRIFYPFVFRLGPPTILLVTGPNYCVIFYCILKSVAKVYSL